MATLAQHNNLLRLRSRDSCTPRDSVDEIQSNGSLLQGKCVKVICQTTFNCYIDRSYRTTKFKCWRNSDIIAGVIKFQYIVLIRLSFKGTLMQI